MNSTRQFQTDRRRLRNKNAVILMFMVILSHMIPTAQASQALRRELSGISESVAQILDGRGQDSVAIGPVTGPSTLETGGPGIQQMLREELEKHGVHVKRRAEVVINGTYSGELTDRGLVLQLQVTLVNSLGKPLVEINSSKIEDFPVRNGTILTRVQDERTAIAFLQPTSHIPPDIPPQDRANLVKSSLDGNEGPPHIRDGAVFAKASSPYGVAVLVNGQARTPTIEDDMAFIDIQRGEEYEVRLINNSRHRAAARLMIDGLNSFAFSEVLAKSGPRKGQPAYDHWILSPHSTGGTIPGWHKRNSGKGNFVAFKVTEYADSAAGLLGHKSDLGTITVVFSAAWEAGTEPPADLKEPPKRRGLPDSTGFGKPKSQDVKPVQVEIGVVRAAVSIRYSRPQ